MTPYLIVNNTLPIDLPDSCGDNDLTPGAAIAIVIGGYLGRLSFVGWIMLGIVVGVML